MDSRSAEAALSQNTTHFPAIPATASKSIWWAVASRFLLHGLIVSTWVSRIPTIKAALGLNNAVFGLTLLGTAVGSVLAVPAAGWLVTRFGSKALATWSALGFSVALVLPSLAVGPWSLFAALTLFGAMAGTNDVSINSQGVELEAAVGAPTMSRFHAMFSIGGMIGASLGGIIAAAGIAPQAHLSGAAALFLAFGFLTASRLPDRPPTKPASHEASLGWRRLTLPPVLLTLALIGFAMFLSEGAIADWSGVYLRQTLGASPALSAAAYAVFSAGMALFRLLGDSITKRFGSVRTLRGSALIAAAGLSLALLAHSAHGVLFGFALTGAGLSVIVPLVFAASGRVKSVAGSAGIALVSGSGYVGFLFGPPLIGLLAQRGSLQSALFLLVALTLVAAALAPAVRPR